MCTLTTPSTNQGRPTKQDEKESSRGSPVTPDTCTSITRTSSATTTSTNTADTIDEEQFIQGARLERRWEEWKQDSETKTTTLDNNETTIIRSLRPYDVLFGRGNSKRLGNNLVRRALHQNVEFYARLGSFHEKRRAAVRLVEYFQSYDGLRFVQQQTQQQQDDGVDNAKDGYVIAPFDRTVVRIQQCLRDYFTKDYGSPAKKLLSVTSNNDNNSCHANKNNNNNKNTTTPTASIIPRRKTSTSKSTTTTTTTIAKKRRGAFVTTKRIQAAKAQRRRFMAKSVQVGDRLGIYWPMDRSYYPCVVVALAADSGDHDDDDVRSHPHELVRVHYDDGDQEELDLTKHDFFLWKGGGGGEETANNKKKPRPSEIAQRIELDLRKAAYAKLYLLQQQEEPTTTNGGDGGGVLGETRDRANKRRRTSGATKRLSKTLADKAEPPNFHSVRGPDGRFIRVPILPDADVHVLQPTTTTIKAATRLKAAPLAAMEQPSVVMTNAV